MKLNVFLLIWICTTPSLQIGKGKTHLNYLWVIGYPYMHSSSIRGKILLVDIWGYISLIMPTPHPRSSHHLAFFVCLWNLYFTSRLKTQFHTSITTSATFHIFIFSRITDLAKKNMCYIFFWQESQDTQ